MQIKSLHLPLHFVLSHQSHLNNIALCISSKDPILKPPTSLFSEWMHARSLHTPLGITNIDKKYMGNEFRTLLI